MRTVGATVRTGPTGSKRVDASMDAPQQVCAAVLSVTAPDSISERSTTPPCVTAEESPSPIPNVCPTLSKFQKSSCKM